MIIFSPGEATEKTLYVIEREGFLFFCIPRLYPQNIKLQRSFLSKLYRVLTPGNLLFDNFYKSFDWFKIWEDLFTIKIEEVIIISFLSPSEKL